MTIFLTVFKMNFFSSKTSAEKYAVGRPDFHASTINHIREFLHIENKLPKALDIACGTGLSTKALLLIADDVYGTDLSPEMLAVAHEKDKIHYTIAPAEKQPFENDEFDLITVSSGVHWFNIDAFLNEANRLLKNQGWLVIYENFFAGEMEGRDDFKTWLKEVYLQRFPSPPRNKNYDWSPENLQTKNFTIRIPENFKNPQRFNRQQLINYFITQSNIIAAVESGDYTYAAIEQWLNDELSAYFEDADTTHVFYYGNWIKYLQKV
jgi:ubiquinone/menaquinone biosynthesis C-methylase UbiE